MKSSLFALCLLLGFAAGLGFAQPASAQVSPTERAVLLELFGQTSGNKWLIRQGWTDVPEPPVCTWFGVICDAQQNLVGLDLHRNNLVGALPPLTELTGLQTFNISDNRVHGAIPTLTGLANLQSFNVAQNLLTGTIPSLNGLTKLQDFTIDHNRLSGSIPALNRLTSLRTLNLSANQFTGSLPDLDGLTNLQLVIVDHNHLIGPLPAPPASIVNGASNVCPNEFSPATEPPSDNDLAWNAATGVTPWSKDCRRTVQIRVSTDPPFAHVGAAVDVGITVASVSGQGTPSGTVTVTSVNTTDPTCTTTLTASSTTSCTLQFASNGERLLTVTYEGDDIFAQTTTTAQLVIEALPDSERAVLDALFLQTGGSNWSGQNNWPQGVSCGRFGVTCDDTGPHNAGGTHVLRIELQENNLVGSLPPLTDLASLQTFDVTSNQLRGSIPPLIGLNNLQVFSVNENQLTGVIPTLTGLTSLTILDFSANRLTGSIPPLTDQTNLQIFNIRQNGLTGPLPALPPSPTLGLVSLCPNPLTPAADPLSANDRAWNEFLPPIWSDATPLRAACALDAVHVTVSASPTVQSNDAVVVTVAVFPGGDGTGTATGTVTVGDSVDSDASCTATLKDGSGICAVVLFSPGTHTLTAGYSGSASLPPGSGSTEVRVIAPATAHTIGGVVSGLVGTGLVLSLNAGAQTLAIPANTSGGFAFPIQLADGSNYAVTVLTQPTAPAQTCTVANGRGTLAGQDVSNVAVLCTDVPVQSNVVQTPTLSGWLLALLGAALIGIALLRLERRRTPRLRL